MWSKIPAARIDSLIAEQKGTGGGRKDKNCASIDSRRSKISGRAERLPSKR